jgi:hypothetical protein
MERAETIDVLMHSALIRAESMETRFRELLTLYLRDRTRVP